jgi:succinate-acetate transporter protein
VILPSPIFGPDEPRLETQRTQSMSTTNPSLAPALAIKTKVVHKFADPGPLGLAAFALTTFVLSMYNANFFKGQAVVFGLALAYGGLAQIIAGIWEFTRKNTFGATAFISFGAFWVSFWYLTNHTSFAGLTSHQTSHAIGIYLVAWFIFTASMFVISFRTNLKLQLVFGLLTATFAFLALGALSMHSGLTHVGGYFGLATAAAAWFAAFSGIWESLAPEEIVPVASETAITKEAV